MIKLKDLIFISIITLFLFSQLSMAQQQENSNDFNASEHIFFGQEILNTFFALGFIICFGIFFIPFIVGLLIAIWIYKDANKRGDEGIIWALIFIILSILSYFGLVIIIILLIIWLTTRPSIRNVQFKRIHPDRRCPQCGRVIPWEAKACPYCAKIFE